MDHTNTTPAQSLKTVPTPNQRTIYMYKLTPGGKTQNDKDGTLELVEIGDGGGCSEDLRMELYHKDSEVGGVGRGEGGEKTKCRVAVRKRVGP